MKTKILLVDDDPNIRQLVNLYLDQGGLRGGNRPTAATTPLENVQDLRRPT